MGVLTKYFGFLKAEPNENVDVEKHINDTFDSIDNLLHTQSDEIGTKEPKIIKKSGFNLDITDRKDLNDSNKVVSAKALKEVNEEATKIATTTNSGRVKIGKNLTIKSDGTLEGEDPYSLPKATTSLVGGVKIGKNLTIKSDGTLDAKDQEVDLGTTSGTALEGSKLAETLGIPYGGILNNSTSKVAGTAYYDNTTKKTYKCTSTTSLNYAESTKFEAISNNDLLLKFQNLNYYKEVILFEGSKGVGNITLNRSLLDFMMLEFQTTAFSGIQTTLISTKTLMESPSKTFAITSIPWGGNVQNSTIQYISSTTLKHAHPLGGGNIVKIKGIIL